MNGDKKGVSYDVRIDGAYSDIVKPGYERLVRRFRPIVDNTSEAPEVQLLSALTMRITRLAMSAKVLSESGLALECLLIQRAAFEAFVNLCYIFHSSQQAGVKTTRELCIQFCAYGDIAYFKLISANKDKVREVFARRKNMDSDEFEHFYLKAERKRDDALRLGCTKTSWISIDTRRLIEIVEKFPPSWFDQTLHGAFSEMLTSTNSAVHSDALSLRSHYAETDGHLLHIVYDEEYVKADAVAIIATGSWIALGAYFNEEKWVTQMIGEEVRAALNPRLLAAKAEQSALVKVASKEDVENFGKLVDIWTLD